MIISTAVGATVEMNEIFKHSACAVVGHNVKIVLPVGYVFV